MPTEPEVEDIVVQVLDIAFDFFAPYVCYAFERPWVALRWRCKSLLS